MPKPKSLQANEALSRIYASVHGRERRIMGQVQQVQTAVLVPLVQTTEGKLAVLFEKRAAHLRRQPGEISFPGGHCEPADRDERYTALRETSEELGVPISDIDCVGELDVLVAWSGLIVYPYVGFIASSEAIRPNPAEVSEVFTVELDRLLTLTPAAFDVPLVPNPPDDFPYHWIPNGRAYKWRTALTRQLFYTVDDDVIWGLTARILFHFLSVCYAQSQTQQ